MSKYIKEFNKTGNCIANVPLICKHWNNSFFISTYKTENGTDYTFYIRGKRKESTLCRIRLSEEQALEIVSKLSLVYVGSTLFRSGGAYYGKEYLDAEIVRLNDILNEKRFELQTIQDLVSSFERALI